MKKKIYEMNQKLTGLKSEIQDLIDSNNVNDAKEKMKEAKALKEAIDLQQELLESEDNSLLEKAKEHIENNDITKSANIVRAMLKKVTGRSLTEAENALLIPTTGSPNGENGEAYILPQDIRTRITKKMRDYSSMRDIVGYIPTNALTGSFPVENFETLSELVDFTDGTDGEDVTDISFKNVAFSLKEKAAFIKLSNTLLSLSDEPLLEYVAEIFAKKAVLTENKMIIEALKKGKSAQTIAGWKGLKSGLNKLLDPAALSSAVIITNQDGYDYLDSEVDTIGRPILQPDLSKPGQSLFKGIPVKVFSNSILATAGTKAPIFFGALKEGVKFVDLNGAVAFAASSAAGFLSNTTIARLIEFIDVVQSDSSDKCYVYGEIDISPTE